MKSNDLYKYAASGMVKKAFEFNTTAKAGLIGALGGAGLGALSDYLTPKDKDENRTKRLLTNILSGALMGGLTGVGGATLYNNFVSTPSSDNSPTSETLDTSVTPQNLDPSIISWYKENAPDVPWEGLAAIPAGGAILNLKGALSAQNKIRAVKKLTELNNFINSQITSNRASDIVKGINKLNKDTNGLSINPGGNKDISAFNFDYSTYKKNTSFWNRFKSLFSGTKRNNYRGIKQLSEEMLLNDLEHIGNPKSKSNVITTPHSPTVSKHIDKIVKTIKRTGGANDVGKLTATRGAKFKGAGKNLKYTVATYLIGKALGGVSDAVRESVQ